MDCRVIDTDIYIYTSEHYLADKGKYRGVCKLPNGAEVVVFEVFGEETGCAMCQVLYYDGNILRTFTPYQGSTVNIATRTHLGDERYMKKGINSDFFNKVYSDGIDFDSYDFDEGAFTKYCVFTSLVKSENEAENLKGKHIHLDWDSIEDEIEKALC